VAGLVCGGVYAFSGYLINSNNEQGHDIAAVTSLLLAAAMGARLLKYVFLSLQYLTLARSGKFMPAGLVTVCASAVGSYSVYQALKFRGMLE
jgi:uncharacterized membrane protein (UPF0136 family)